MGSLWSGDALVFTFILVGIWHGAGFKYAVFGLIHGVLVAYSTLTFARRDKYWRSLGIPRPVLFVGRAAATFLIVTATFVLFRAGSLTEAIWIYKAIITGSEGVRTVALTNPLIAIIAVVTFDILATLMKDLKPFPSWLRLTGYYAVIGCIIVASINHALQASLHAQQFIYFKF